MNDEQAKRVAEAADAVLGAGDAVDEARDAVNDRRFDGEVERDRVAAAQQMVSKLDNAGKKLEEALRKAAIASAALAREGAYERYRTALGGAREGRALARSAPEQDGSANRKARGGEALAKFEEALAGAAALVFG